MINKKYKILLSILFVIIILEMILIFTNHKISISLSNSLPFKFFLINKNIDNVKFKNGDYIQFKNDDIKYYGGKQITKQIFASEGDVLEIIKYEVIKDNIQGKIIFNNVILEVKDFTALGTKLEINNIEKIENDNFFVIGEHKDSYDSRYKSFGLIKKEDIIGIAKPFF